MVKKPNAAVAFVLTDPSGLSVAASYSVTRPSVGSPEFTAMVWLLGDNATWRSAKSGTIKDHLTRWDRTSIAVTRLLSDVAVTMRCPSWLKSK